MNNHNQQNIEFVRSLALRPRDLEAWLQSIHESGDQDEIEYAFMILTVVRNLIEIELLEIYDAESQDDVSLASAYLRRFQLQ